MGSTCLLLIVNVYKLLKHYLRILGSRQKIGDKKLFSYPKSKRKFFDGLFCPIIPDAYLPKRIYELSSEVEQQVSTVNFEKAQTLCACTLKVPSAHGRRPIAIIGRVHCSYLTLSNSESSFLWQYLLKLGGKLPLISLLSGNVAPVHCAMLLENRPLEREVAVACVA